ncbi:MAG: DUF5367 family protein [Halolamina sp.]
MIRNLSTEDVRALFGFGVAIWLIATVVLTFAAFLWREIRPAARPAAAILLVVPGMLLDVVLLSFFGAFFPTMERGSVRYFAGLLLLALATVLLIGLFSKGR